MSDENWVRLLACEELSPGNVVGVEIGDSRVAVYNVDGEFYVTDNVCTHAFALLSDGWFEDRVIECPLHGGRFDVTNGAALSEPAECDLRTYPVRLVDDYVEAHLPE